MKWATALFIGAFAPLLYCNTFEVEGYFNGVSTEIYSDGSEHYCLQPNNTSSSATIQLDSYSDACIYLADGSVLGTSCGRDPSLSLTGLSDKTYKVILASRSDRKYTLNVTIDGNFDRCTDYYQAGYIGMRTEDINLILMLSGVLSAIGFYAAITYVILTLGNF